MAEVVLARVLLEQWLEDCHWKTLQEYVADVKHAYAPHIDITTDIDEDERQQMENLHRKLSKQESNCSSAFLNSAFLWLSPRLMFASYRNSCWRMTT